MTERVADFFDDALEALSEDMSEATQRLRAQDSQFNRRVYIKTFFAFLEGFAWALRKATIDLMHYNALKHHKLNIDRLILLREEFPTLDNTGKLSFRKHQLPFISYFAFTLRSFAEEQHFDPDFFVDIGWGHFQKAVKIRDRLTHPKRKQDMSVSNAELGILVKTQTWFQHTVMARIDKARASG